MVSQFRAVIEALNSGTDLVVIPTMRSALKKEYPLPAIVVDYDKPVFEEFAENGPGAMSGNSYLVIIAVKSLTARDPLDELAELEQHLRSCIDALSSAFPQSSISVLDPDIDDILFGKQDALAITFELQIQ
jgi:hypothetical protein